MRMTHTINEAVVLALSTVVPSLTGAVALPKQDGEAR
jgi:hypothetical protein